MFLHKIAIKAQYINDVEYTRRNVVHLHELEHLKRFLCPAVRTGYLVREPLSQSAIVAQAMQDET